MSKRTPLRVSGLLQAGKVTVNPNIEPITDFGTLGVDDPASADGAVLPLNLIDDSPFQPRMVYDPAEIDNLAHSLAAAGLEDAITVRAKDNGRFELISGHRRTRAARSLGWVVINARIVTKTDRQAELATMVQNEARVDLTDFERAKLYQTAIDSGFGKTQTDIANLFGTTQGRVSTCMAMLKLPPVIVALLEDQPALFSRVCGEAIGKLLKSYPSEIDLIRDSVLRIKNDGADQKSVTQWVEQMVKHKRGAVSPKQRAVVTDHAGQEMYVVKRSSREITIQIKDPSVDTADVENLMLSALRQSLMGQQNKLSNLDNLDKLAESKLSNLDNSEETMKT